MYPKTYYKHQPRECLDRWNLNKGRGSKVANNELDIDIRTKINKFQSKDAWKTTYGGGEFKLIAKEGVGVGGIFYKVWRCFCIPP